MKLKGIEVGNPEIGLLFKTLQIDKIVTIKNFSHRLDAKDYNQLKKEGELELTLSEFNDLHCCRTYVK